MNIKEVCDAARDYQRTAMTAIKSANFVSGSDVIAIRGDIIEPSWEWFNGAVSVALNDKLLYDERSVNVGSYHNEPYTMGMFHNLDDACKYLEDNFGDREFEQQPYQVDWSKLDHGEKHWSNPKFAETMRRIAEAEQSNLPVDDKGNVLTRIVFRDKGISTRKGEVNGRHLVDFAYACDMTEPDVVSPGKTGKGFPYMVNRFVNGKGPFHNVALENDLYERLMSHANTEGNLGSWTGVVNGAAFYPLKGGKHASVYLTRDAARHNMIQKPAEPFDVDKHDACVRAVRMKQMAVPGIENEQQDTISAEME